MPKNYEYREVEVRNLLLDEENPRFASSILVKESSNKITQEMIVEHLLRHSDVIKLAQRINDVGELHGSEIIACIKKGDKFVVLEGNRRTCACKLLLDRKMIPEQYKNNFPFITEHAKANIERVLVVIYPNRESVQSYLSDRHIAGVKKWSALEKNNYYMNLFLQYGNVESIKKHTSDSVSVVTKSIIKYQFFMDVFNILKLKYKDLEIEKIDYLPMVDRFMETIVGNDEDVGLNLEMDNEKLQYICPLKRRELYDSILLKIGEAFLIRKEKKFCKENELPKVVGSEIYAKKDQKNLIIEDQRIPGLYCLIQQYKNEQSLQQDYKENSEHDNKSENSENNTDYNYERTGNIKSDKNNTTKDTSKKFIPEVKYKLKTGNIETLYFTKEEAINFQLEFESDYNSKVKSLLNDLGQFSVYTHPYTVALLYRTLLEICTKRVYDIKASEVGRTYNEKDLKSNMLYLTNNFLFNKSKQKDVPKIKETIKGYFSEIDIIQILNLYIHYSNPVDENIILSSWKSLKKYVQACLEK